jgi:tetratricopeptide (TPR) repeat protein
MKTRIAGILAGLMLFWLAGAVYAQVGAMRGFVKDEEGNPIEGVTVTIEGIEIKRSYTVKTDRNGRYLHAGIPLQGTYQITAKKDGYISDGIRGVRAGFGPDDPDRGPYNFVLKPGESGKLAFELSQEELEAMRKQQQEAEKRRAASAAVQQAFQEGLQFFNLNQYEQAASAFQRAAEADPEQVAVWANLGLSYHRMKRLDQSLESYQKALALKPDDANIYQNLGSVYSDMGQLDKSREMYEKAVSLTVATNPKAAAVQYYNMGVTFINTGRNEEAIDALLKAIESDPQHAESHYQLGITYLGVNKMEESVASLRKYLELKPNGEEAETAQALIESLAGM